MKCLCASNYSLSIVLATLFLLSWVVQTWTGWGHFKAEQFEQGQSAEVFVPSKFGKLVDCIIATNAGLPDTRSQPKMNHLTGVHLAGSRRLLRFPFRDELINCEPKLLSCWHERSMLFDGLVTLILFFGRHIRSSISSSEMRPCSAPTWAREYY